MLGSSADSWLGLAAKSLTKVSFVSDEDLPSVSKACDMILGAGPTPQLMSILDRCPTSTPVLLVTKKSEERRLAFSNRLVTTWLGSVWTRDWEMGKWPRTVRRDIGHVLIHSDMPRACKPNPSFKHLTPSQLLPLDGSDLPVVFHSFGTYTNWGYRKLSHKETAYAMDLPVRLVNDRIGLLVWINRHERGLAFPLKPLQVALKLLMLALGGSDILEPETQIQPTPELASTGSWLSSLNRELSNAWALADAVSAKAVKADNAQIATAMWDKRVSLVLQWTHTDMARLRLLAFGHWQRLLRRDFQAYMTANHGSTWLARVLTWRRRALMAPAPRVSSSPRSILTGGTRNFKSARKVKQSSGKGRC